MCDDAMTTDGQPGGSGAGSTVSRCEDCLWLVAKNAMEGDWREDGHLSSAGQRRNAHRKGSGAGSTVDKLWSYSELLLEVSRLRATEAELRAKVELATLFISAVAENGLPQQRNEAEHLLTALDAAEPPAARGETSQDGANRHLTGPSATGARKTTTAPWKRLRSRPRP